MKNIIKRFKANKLLFIIAMITIMSILFGILFLAIQANDIKEQVKLNLDNIIETFNTNKYNSLDLTINSIKTNIIINSVIWLLGVSIVGIPIILMIYIIKNIMLGFTLASFIYFYKIIGLFIGLIYILPHILNNLLLFITTYYSISFSILIYKSIFKNKEYNKRVVVRRYFKVLLYISILLIISSLIEGYLIPIILRLIIL